MGYVVSIALLLLAIIHLAPAVGALGNKQLTSLYGIAIDNPDIAILMRHRAFLFGLLGSFLVVAAFVPSLQIGAFIAGFVSLVSFLLLARSVGGYNSRIGRAVAIDVAALVILGVGLAAHALQG